MQDFGQLHPEADQWDASGQAVSGSPEVLKAPDLGVLISGLCVVIVLNFWGNAPT